MPPQKTPPTKWKPPKGPKPVQHRQKNTVGLGKAILYQRAKENKVEILPDGESRFTTDKKEDDWVKLRSVTQESHIEDFLNSAALANTDFTAVKRNQMTIINTTEPEQNYLLTEEKEKELTIEQLKNKNKLVIPRRPDWDASTTKQELQESEKKGFLEWRRDLAILQKNNDLLLTPFERNLEVWRQLWRVIERSDLVVQIVDARNPLLFRSVDLETYTKELNPKKRNLLLVNKADLLSVAQRIAWAKYFIKHDIPYAFFSAGQANELLEKEEEEKRNERIFDTAPSKEQDFPAKKAFDISSKNLEDKIQILTVNELEDLFIHEAPEPLTVPPNPDDTPKLQIGFVGYPNVGKSSTLNALVGSKKVSVSATPGKTKHFQTINLTDEIILCDCPGLVFPNFAHTNAELVCNGILPINQLRESMGPSSLVAQRIPKFYLEAIYGIAIPIKSVEDGGTGIPSARELLTAYARARGYMTQGFGSADVNRAARFVLKDYVNGKLLFVSPPPNEDGSGRPLAECLEFNKELYTLDLLAENRKKQIIKAINENPALDLATFDLSKDLAKLSFSSHIAATGTSGSKSISYGGTNAKLHSDSQELNDEFFQFDRVNGVLNKPFYTRDASSTGKKHKKTRKVKTRNLK